MKQKKKVVMDGYIKIKINLFYFLFTKSNKFNLSNKDDLGYYLNHTFYKTLTNQDYLVEGIGQLVIIIMEGL